MPILELASGENYSALIIQKTNGSRSSINFKTINIRNNIMFNSKQFFLGLALLCSLGLANAGSVTINESLVGNTGYYSVTNNTEEAIWLFAVSHTAASNAQTTRNYYNTSPLSLFGAETISKVDWNAGLDSMGVGSDYDFDTYFGSDTLVNVYFELDGFGISAGETTGNQFSFTAIALASNWIALGVNGGVYTGTAITGGVNAVPLPAAFLLFGPALLGFLGFRRKLQA